jgi:hypothetical protein
MWAFSFMKSGRAAQFVDQHMRSYQNVGLIWYKTWGEFVEYFVADFCPKNEVQTLRTELETSRFFQNGRTVNKYVDDFKELVDCAQYFEGAHIVLKFRQGLNPKVQDHVACLTLGCPLDESPKQWYNVAILCNENHIPNEAFQTSSRIAQLVQTLLNTGGSLEDPCPMLPCFQPPFCDSYPLLSMLWAHPGLHHPP